MQQARILGGGGTSRPFSGKEEMGMSRLHHCALPTSPGQARRLLSPFPRVREALVLRQCGTPLHREMQSQEMKRLSGVVPDSSWLFEVINGCVQVKKVSE